MKNFLSENNFLIFFLLILGISIMNVMKIVKIGLMTSISSNLIHSDWCELCFSDYKEINPPESNLAEEAQKIKESKNKTENNGGKNIKKTNINEFEDQSNTNYSNARKAKTKRNYTSNGGIIPEGIEMSNKMYTNNGNNIAETPGYKNSETEMESPDPNDFNYNSSLDHNELSYNSSQNRNDYNYNSENMIENIREDSSNNKKDFSNNRGYFSSNIDENSIINNEVAGNNSEEKIDETNSKEGIAENNSGNEEVAETNPRNQEVTETNPKEDSYPKTRDDKE